MVTVMPSRASTMESIPSWGTKNCGKFATWQEVQAWFDTYYPHYGNVAWLEFDNDRDACERLPDYS
ncbi:hypothetical protein [Marisediminicola antarctica]|uniref:Excalibur calcium-binding domain-containing protein n=1 Tax=Marisediminicola antarctica TaxID=674079 RepID=A0A7L5AIE8_9MICO|nr:hypothetical protein [Marisediminicola antarctica]QHO70348.1 hypothetical protein BHD05_12515 [Marisediminicola antarctica]